MNISEVILTLMTMTIMTTFRQPRQDDVLDEVRCSMKVPP